MAGPVPGAVPWGAMIPQQGRAAWPEVLGRGVPWVGPDPCAAMGMNAASWATAPQGQGTGPQLGGPGVLMPWAARSGAGGQHRGAGAGGQSVCRPVPHGPRESVSLWCGLRWHGAAAGAWLAAVAVGPGCWAGGPTLGPNPWGRIGAGWGLGWATGAGMGGPVVRWGGLAWVGLWWGGPGVLGCCGAEPRGCGGAGLGRGGHGCEGSHDHGCGVAWVPPPSGAGPGGCAEPRMFPVFGVSQYHRPISVGMLNLCVG